MKHKHAAVLIAIAEGKEVEWKIQGDDEWHIASFQPYTPITHPDFDWRIKPEPKPDVIKYAIASIDEENRERLSIETDDWASILTKHQTEEDNLKLTFDGETLKLKSAEVTK